MKKLVSLALALVMVLCAMSALAEIELKWYQPEPETHPWTQASYMIAEEIEKNSNGEIKVTIYPGAVLGTQAEAVDMLRYGDLALLTSGPSILASWCDQVQVYSLPYAFEDPAQAYAFFESDISQDIFNKTILDASGVRTLDVWYFGDRNLTIKGMDTVTDPSQIAGKAIRCMDTPISKSVVASLGGSPVPMNISELYLALQTGVVVGQENPIPTIIAQKFYEVQDAVVLTRHSVHMGTVHVSEIIWKTLSADQQKVITDALAKYRPVIEEMINENTEAGLAELKEKGVSVSEPDLTPFRANAQKVLEETFGGDEAWMSVINALNTFKEEYNAAK